MIAVRRLPAPLSRLAYRLRLVGYCERCDWSIIDAREWGPPAADVVMPHWRHKGPYADDKARGGARRYL